MAIFTKQLIGYTGVNVTHSAAVGPFDGTAPGDRVFAWIKNTGGVSRDVVIIVPGTTFEQNNPDVSVTIAAGQERMIGPLDANLTDPTAGVVLWAYSSATGLTVAAVELPTPPADLP